MTVGVNRYVAFLRGINVGGRGILKMKDLARMFVSAGCENVRTTIQSGNVIFEARAKNADTLHRKVEKRLRDHLGMEVKVLLRTVREVENLAKLDPFKHAGEHSDGNAFGRHFQGMSEAWITSGTPWPPTDRMARSTSFSPKL